MRVLVDASVFITLAKIDRLELLAPLEGRVEIPAAVRSEIVDEPAASRLEHATTAEPHWIQPGEEPAQETLDAAAAQLGVEADEKENRGDVALLAAALRAEDAVVVTDDKPLRQTCKALGLPVSGSIGVLIAAVQRGDLDPAAAKEALVAMDEVGARLSARLLRRAESLIEEAADG